tara:strand:+ start:2096 stop:2287 length:192 start_codon:yes stop_codon:yes gene_type:complete
MKIKNFNKSLGNKVPLKDSRNNINISKKGLDYKECDLTKPDRYNKLYPKRKKSLPSHSKVFGK